MLPPEWGKYLGSDKLQLKTAEFVIPAGYTVEPARLDVIHASDKFSRSVGESAVLTKEKLVPFAVRKSGNGVRMYVVMNGTRSTSLGIGRSMKVPGTNCYVWLYKIGDDEATGSFELRCN